MIIALKHHLLHGRVLVRGHNERFIRLPENCGPFVVVIFLIRIAFFHFIVRSYTAESHLVFSDM